MNNGKKPRVIELLERKMKHFKDLGIEFDTAILEDRKNSRFPSNTPHHLDPSKAPSFDDGFVAMVAEIRSSLVRIADHFDPPERAVVGTKYISERLGVSVRWVGDLVRNGEIPKSCVCPQSGDGKYWRFWKDKIDEWINTQAHK